MKKVVRTVWISLLSGLAFLVACVSPKGLTRAEKKQLKEERVTLMAQIQQQKEESLIVTDPKIMMGMKDNELQLRQRLNEINSRLGDDDAIASNDYEMGIISAEIDSLQTVIENAREPEPCVYGPPPVDPPMPRKQQLERDRKDLISQYSEIRRTVERREGACVYGPPEVIARYNDETQNLKRQMNDIAAQIQAIEAELKELDGNE